MLYQEVSSNPRLRGRDAFSPTVRFCKVQESSDEEKALSTSKFSKIYTFKFFHCEEQIRKIEKIDSKR